MKSLENPNDKADWESSLLSDISFIKTKKRYPFNKKTLTPASISALVWVLLLRTSFLLIMGSKSSNPYVIWTMYGSVVLLALIVLYQYFKVLKFDTISTQYHLNKNTALLKKFFTTNNLAFTQHDDASDVFMIISRNLNSNPNKEYREVMVFIADDKQILVNSHFTGNKFSITPPSRNFRKMSKELKHWLDIHIDKADSTTVAVKGF